MSKATRPAALAAGDTVDVLDWSRNPNKPTAAKATVTAVNKNGSINVTVNAEGVEPYEQEGLVERTTGDLVPGEFKRIAAPAAPAAAETPAA